MNISDDFTLAGSIAQAVAQAGGRAYFVGGFVRDRLLGLDNKDIDIEVHGILPEKLESILQEFGECKRMGVSFGIYSLRHSGLDIAMPRTETATGRGHRDFEVFVDPFLGVRKAAMRRDFTVNALMQDVLTGDVIDSFGGVADLKHGILRHVNDATFVEDPLRVLRCAQFAARFGFSVDPSTVALCRTMDLSALARERVFGELQKALRKAPRPSVFFETLLQMQQLEGWFPEVLALRENGQWLSCMKVLDYTASLRENAQNADALMLSALCRFLSAPDSLLSRLTSSRDLFRYVTNMHSLCLKPDMLLELHASEKDFMCLLDASVCPADLLLLSQALRGKAGENQALLTEYLRKYDRLMLLPRVRGEDLLAAGISPSPLFARAIDYAHSLHLSGIPREDALSRTLQWIEEAQNHGQ